MSKTKCLRFALTAALVLLGSASTAWCNSAAIVVDPDGLPPAGQFWYSLHVAGGVTFNPGDEIFFSGMSGVTGAFANSELSGAFASDVSFTDTTATFGFAFPPGCNCGVSDTLIDDQGAPYSALVIDPPADTTVGMIDWAIIQGGVTTYSGTVEGPVAVAPEPGAIGLTFLGLGLLLVARKRTTPCLPQGS